MDFSSQAGASTGYENIPNGQLAWAIVNFCGLKASEKGGQYLDLELTIDEGQPYAKKKIWDMVGDPYHPGNSDKYKQMGSNAICRMLEAGNNAGPQNPAGYQLPDYSKLHGLRVAIKIGIEPPHDGYDEKNKVAEYLTPNPQSGGNKHFQALVSGQFNVNPNAGRPAAPPAQSSMFGSPQPQQPAQQAPQAGFQQPAAGQQPQQSAPVQGAGSWGSPSQDPAVSASTASTTSPSDQNGGAPASPDWLAQANAGQS